MSVRTVIAALIFGASVAVGGHLLSRQTEKPPEVKTTDVVVAVKDVPKGATLTAEMLAMRPYASEVIPPEAVTKIDDALDRRVAVSVRKGMLLDNQLVPKEASQGLPSLIPTGMRAFTIHTPSVASGVAGLVQPGDHVDILLTVDSRGRDDQTGGARTVTLLQNVEILAVDKKIDSPQGPAPTSKIDPKNVGKSVTLLIDPEQAVWLHLAQNKGTLHLSLRNPAGEDMATELPSVTLNELLGRNKKPAEEDSSASTEEASLTEIAEEHQALPAIVTYRGTSRGVVPLQAAGRQNSQKIVQRQAVASSDEEESRFAGLRNEGED